MAKKSRKTRQKELIKEEMEKFSSFFTAEELFKKVKNKDKKLGIATVYRFLKELREKNLLHSYSCDRKIAYSKENNSHCHFICQKCKQVTHFDIKTIDFLKNKFKGSSICHFQVDVHGLCNKCANKK